MGNQYTSVQCPQDVDTTVKSSQPTRLGLDLFNHGPCTVMVRFGNDASPVDGDPLGPGERLRIMRGGWVYRPAVAPTWDSGTTYDLADLVYGSDANLYESVQAANLNHEPVGDGGTWWDVVGSDVWQFHPTTHIHVYPLNDRSASGGRKIPGAGPVGDNRIHLHEFRSD